MPKATGKPVPRDPRDLGRSAPCRDLFRRLASQETCHPKSWPRPPSGVHRRRFRPATPSGPLEGGPSHPVWLETRALATTLHVCVTCRQGRTLLPEEIAPGRVLYDELVDLAQMQQGAPGIAEVSCLAACSSGCTASLNSSGKWTLLLGGLDQTKAADILDFVRLYDEHKTGMVMPSRRAESLRTAIFARIPG